MLPIIGKAKFHNFPAYLAWHAQLTKEQALKLWQDYVYTRQSILGKPYDNIYTNCNAMGFDSGNQQRREQLTKFQDYLEMMELPWDVRYVDLEKKLMVISYGQCDDDTKSKANQFLIENWPEYLEYTPFTDYTATSLAELRQLTLGSANGLTGSASLIPKGAGADLSIERMRTAMGLQEKKMDSLKAQIQAVEACETKELLPLKEKMDKLKAEMEQVQRRQMAKLDALKAEMEAKKAEMEKQIFMLDSEIYSIRCFLGETVNFVKLRSGKNAPLEQPVVLYQKMRFMLEDLGKFAIMWPEEKLSDSIERSLAKSDKLLEAFAPAEKCITLIRYSETGRTIAPHEDLRNYLDTYELLHGNQVAILIRNGENLYISWLDEDRITMRDDFFLKPTKAEVLPMPERKPGESEWSFNNRTEKYEKDLEKENKRNALEGLSRYFLFAILNGISASEHSILPLPKFANAAERSRHILFSMADGTLTDNRYGNFGDIIARCNSVIKKGDHILTTLALRPEEAQGRRSQTWFNSRGRGEKNRTHDVRASDCSIYRINLVEFDPPKPMKRYLFKFSGVDGEKWIEAVTKADSKLSDETKVIEYFDQITQHNFISLEKDCWWYSGDETRPAHANFEVFTAEFINLTYMNSCWLNYILSTKNVHGWRIKGTDVNYAYALRYISKALQFVREREITERENILAAGGETVLENPDWPVAVSEWKLATGVRELTEYQAKRFVKAALAGKIDTTPKTAPKSNTKLLEEDPWGGW